MAASFLTQGLTIIRDLLKTGFTYVCVSTSTEAFDAADTGINPDAGATWTHVGAATLANVSGSSFDATLAIDGSSVFTGQSIGSIGLSDGVGVRQADGAGGTHTGGAVTGTDTICRFVRATPVPVEAGDTVTPGVRITVTDGG